ncbi:MAG: hypothetical protein J6V32_03170 [Elusimicrobiaceae bacterium]|nr:hypothetical protein [Elusimicrobiaceae bacterium]
MNENKSFFIITFALAAMLLLAAALFYTVRPGQEQAPGLPGASMSEAQPLVENQVWEKLKSKEFFEDEDIPQPGASVANLRGGAFSKDAGQPRANKFQQLHRGSADALFVKSSPASSVTQAGRNTVTGSNRLNYEQTPARSGSSVGRGYAMGSGTHNTDNTSDKVAQKTAVAFAPLMSKYTKAQAEKLEKRLAKLPGLIEEAVVRAMLPKSKKDANIEKYLHHRDGEDTAAVSKNPVDVINKQFARQKKSIVNSMKKAYGDKAAGRAGRLMDAYQSEISQALNEPGLDAQQIRQRVRQISNKYNEKLEKLNKQSAQEQAEEQLAAKTQTLQDDLAKAYGDEVANRLGQISTEYDQKALALSQENLTEEEYLRQYYENEHQRRKEMEKTLLDNGKSLKDLREWEDKQEKARIDDMTKAEEEGKQAPQAYQASREEKEAASQNLRKESSEKKELAKQMYGEAGAAQVDRIYKNYEAQTQEILNNNETSRLEKDTLLMQARQEANKELERVLQDPKMKQARIDTQVQHSLNELMKNPEVAAKVPPDQARDVLREMYEAVDKINESKSLSDEQKEQQIKAVQARANHRLAQMAGAQE